MNVRSNSSVGASEVNHSEHNKNYEKMNHSVRTEKKNFDMKDFYKIINSSSKHQPLIQSNHGERIKSEINPSRLKIGGIGNNQTR